MNAKELVKAALDEGSVPEIMNGWVKWTPPPSVPIAVKMASMRPGALRDAVSDYLAAKGGRQA